MAAKSAEAKTEPKKTLIPQKKIDEHQLTKKTSEELISSLQAIQASQLDLQKTINSIKKTIKIKSNEKDGKSDDNNDKDSTSSSSDEELNQFRRDQNVHNDDRRGGFAAF